IVGVDHEEAGVPRIPESLLGRGRGGRCLAEGARPYERRQHHPSSSRHMQKIVFKTGVGQTRPARGPLRGFHSRRISSLRCPVAMDCLRRRRAGVWHWAVTWLHSTSVIHDGPSHFLSSFLSTLTLRSEE